jgi:plasmid stability protein
MKFPARGVASVAGSTGLQGQSGAKFDIVDIIQSKSLPPVLPDPMADLIVRNIDPALVRVLKERAGRHGVSAEAEHRAILAAALAVPARRSLAQVLADIPAAGLDADFQRTPSQPARRPGAGARKPGRTRVPR